MAIQLRFLTAKHSKYTNGEGKFGRRERKERKDFLKSGKRESSFAGAAADESGKAETFPSFSAIFVICFWFGPVPLPRISRGSRLTCLSGPALSLDLCVLLRPIFVS